MPNPDDRHDARVYSLRAAEIVGVDFARTDEGDRTAVVVAAQDGLGNRTFRPIIPASRGNLPTREELEREIRELAAVGRFPADLPEASVRTEAQARIAQRQRFEALRANLASGHTFPVTLRPSREAGDALFGELRRRANAERDRIDREAFAAPPAAAQAERIQGLARHGRVTELPIVGVLVHLNCPEAAPPGDWPIVAPSRHESIRVCSACFYAWSESIVQQGPDLASFNLGRASRPEIRFVEALGVLERHEAGRFSYGRPAEIPDEAEPVATGNPSGLPIYRPR